MRASLQEIRLGGTGVVPVLTVDGGPGAVPPGLTVAVTANLHGDECTGVAAAHALATLLPARLRAGRVHLFPSLNPAGLAAGTRGLPGEDLDPNRAFPGDPGGRAASRHAYALWSELLRRGVDLVLDLHTDTAGALPYALVDRVVRGDPALEERCATLAAGSGLTVLREYPAELYRRFGLDQSLPGALVNGPGIAAVTLEIGPRRTVHAEAVDLAVSAVLGVLSSAGLVELPAPPHATRRSGRWRRENGPRTHQTGVLVPLVRPGQEVGVGHPLGQVRTLAGEILETLVSPCPALVVSLPERAWTGPGVICATLAVVDS